MKYTHSRARKTFTRAINELIRVVRRSETTSTRLRDVRQLANAGAVVRASASLEGYLEDLLAAYVDGIAARPRKAGDLPDNLRFHLATSTEFVESIANFYVSGDEKKWFGRAKEFEGAGFTALHHSEAPVPRIYARDILRKSRYPSPENMKKVFKRVDMNVFGDVSHAIRANAELLLKSFGDVRNALAHDAAAPGLNSKDILDQLHRLKRIVAGIDEVAWRAFRTMPGTAYWLR